MFEFDERAAVSRSGRVTTRPRLSDHGSTSGPRIGRVVRLTATLSLLIALIGYLSSMLQPAHNIPLSIRSVEWLRDNGARGIVNQIENTYYSMTAPSKGGPGLKRLPGQRGSALAGPAAKSGNGKKTHAPKLVHYVPPPIKPLIKPALAGEGVWRAVFKAPGVKYPPVLITSYRSDPAYPQMVAGVAWIDTSETNIHYYPGIQEPSVTLPSRGPEMVPLDMRSKLVATFNSGFKLADAGGGVVLNHHTYAPMKRGLATFVRYSNGKVNVISWPYGPTAPADIVSARQNLPLIVNNRRPNPNLSDGPQWGATLGNAVRVWRSAVGVDSHGDLIYAMANDQTVGSLAQIMIHAGAVRAMQLDINAEWPSFITYTGPGAKGAAQLLPGLMQGPQRYLTPDDRDFYAVYLR